VKAILSTKYIDVYNIIVYSAQRQLAAPENKQKEHRQIGRKTYTCINNVNSVQIEE